MLLRSAGQRAEPEKGVGHGNPDIRPDLGLIYHAPMAFFAFLIIRRLGWIFRWGRPH